MERSRNLTSRVRVQHFTARLENPTCSENPIMFLRLITLAALAAGVFGLAGKAANAEDKKQKPEDQAKAKKALQEVQDFIGLWNLEGTQKTTAKTEAWKEKVSWGWKFKDGDAWIAVSFGDEGKGKYFSTGELKYSLEKKKYLLTLVGTD